MATKMTAAAFALTDCACAWTLATSTALPAEEPRAVARHLRTVNRAADALSHG